VSRWTVHYHGRELLERYEIGAAVLAAGLLGLLVAAGLPLVALGLLAMAAGLFLLTRPRWALWGFLGFLPFFMYPVSFGHLSLFVGLPAALAVSLVLVAATEGRSRGAIRLPAIMRLLFRINAFLFILIN